MKRLPRPRELLMLAFCTLALLACAQAAPAATLQASSTVGPTSPGSTAAPVTAPAPASSPIAASPVPPHCLSSELLVQFRPGVDPATVVAQYGGTIREKIGSIDVYVVVVPPGTVNEKIAVFEADPRVEFAEPNGVVTIPEQPPGTAQPCPP